MNKIIEKYKNNISIVCPHWKLNDIIITKLDKGFSSNNYKLVNKENNQKLFLKIYSDKNSSDNINKLLEFSKKGFGAQILHHFKNGRIEKYYDHRTLKYSDLNSHMLKKIAKLIANFHNITNSFHNDINFNNILILDKAIAKSSISKEINFQQNIILIDFEYANSSTSREYDIANFFIEWIYQYNQDWYNYNLDLFPTMRQINYFCREYLGDKFNDQLLKTFKEKIFFEIKNNHHYWYNWSLKYDHLDYKLFGLNRLKLLEVNFKEIAQQKKIIYTDGTFDLCHIGHIEFFKKIQKFAKKNKLIVGILSDKNVESYKRKPILNTKQRATFIENLKYVDQVIIDCPFNPIDKEFLKYYFIDIVVYGGDPNLKDPLGKWKYHYKIPLDMNILKLIPYSDIQSTSAIIKKIQNYT